MFWQTTCRKIYWLMTPSTCTYLPKSHAEELGLLHKCTISDWLDAQRESTHCCAFRFDFDWWKKSGRNYQMQQVSAKYPQLPETKLLRSQMIWRMGAGSQKDSVKTGKLSGIFRTAFWFQRTWYITFYLSVRNSIVFFFQIVATQKTVE